MGFFAPTIQAVIYDSMGTVIEVPGVNPHFDLLHRLGDRSVDRVMTVSRPPRAFLQRRRNLTPPLIQRFEDNLASSLRDARPYADAEPVLKALAQRGYKQGLISNLASPYEDLVDSSRLAPYLSRVVYSSKTGLIKPEPEIFFKILNEWGLSPHQVLFVGNAPIHDLHGALAAGMQALLIDREKSFPWLESIPCLWGVVDYLTAKPAVRVSRPVAQARILLPGAPRMEAAPSSSPVITELQGKRCLYVSFSKSPSREALSKLESLGLDVTALADSVDALRLIEANQERGKGFDFVVLDPSSPSESLWLIRRCLELDFFVPTLMFANPSDSPVPELISSGIANKYFKAREVPLALAERQGDTQQLSRILIDLQARASGFAQLITELGLPFLRTLGVRSGNTPAGIHAQAASIRADEAIERIYRRTDGLYWTLNRDAAQGELEAALQDLNEALRASAEERRVPLLSPACVTLGCVDEGVIDKSFGLGGSGLVLAHSIGQSNGFGGWGAVMSGIGTVARMLAGVVQCITSHDGCGAAALIYSYLPPEEQIRFGHADGLGEHFSKILAHWMGIHHEHIPFHKMERHPDKHPARLIFYTGTGPLAADSLLKRQRAFTVSRGLLERAQGPGLAESAGKRLLEIILGLILKPDAGRKTGSDQASALIVPIGGEWAPLETLHAEASDVARVTEGRVRVLDGFTLPR